MDKKLVRCPSYPWFFVPKHSRRMRRTQTLNQSELQTRTGALSDYIERRCISKHSCVSPEFLRRGASEEILFGNISVLPFAKQVEGEDRHQSFECTNSELHVHCCVSSHGTTSCHYINFSFFGGKICAIPLVLRSRCLIRTLKRAEKWFLLLRMSYQVTSVMF